MRVFPAHPPPNPVLTSSAKTNPGEWLKTAQPHEGTALSRSHRRGFETEFAFASKGILKDTRAMNIPMTREARPCPRFLHNCFAVLETAVLALHSRPMQGVKDV